MHHPYHHHQHHHLTDITNKVIIIIIIIIIFITPMLYSYATQYSEWCFILYTSSPLLLIVQPIVAEENNAPVTSDCDALKLLIDNGLDIEKVMFYRFDCGINLLWWISLLSSSYDHYGICNVHLVWRFSDSRSSDQGLSTRWDLIKNLLADLISCLETMIVD